ncbi:MAG: carboxypeptidase-like regulatory domain-containing protein [Acidobacteria bacterium]|nr:carboxypeptidase-like regulatory domain-containing protein [Acidobacteriota bacterium]
MKYRAPGRQSLVAVVLTILAFAADTSSGPAQAQTADYVELTVHLDAIASRDEAPSGDVTIEFAEASTRAPVASFMIEVAAEDQSFQVAVPEAESRSGWVASARSEGWWSSTAYIAPDDEEVSLTLVPEGVVRFAVDGTDRGVDLLRSGHVRIAGRVGNRGVRLEQGSYGGPCEVDRQPERREVLIACPFARDETVDLRVRLGVFLPVLRSEVTVAADTDLGLIESVRGAVVTGSMDSQDASSHRFGMRQRDAYGAFWWSSWTDAGGAFMFEGLSPGLYELRLAGSDGDSWPVRIGSLNDRIDLGQLQSAAGNLLTVSFLAPSVLEIGDLKPIIFAVTLGLGGDVEGWNRDFEFEERRSDGSFVWRGLPAGDYEVHVEDRRGNRWHQEVIGFFGQDHYTIELDAVPLVGRIERGGEPLEDAMVWFGGMWGFERISFRSREEGRFSGLLPREGFWPVEVTPAPGCDPCEGGWDSDGWDGFDDREVNDAGNFEIAADSDGVARVRIELPAGTVSGRVVRRNVATGLLEPVEGAYVWMVANEEVAGESLDHLMPVRWRRKTDSSGTFEITGLPEWEYSLSADGWVDDREIRSWELQLQVGSDDRIEDVELLLEDLRPVSIVVRAGGVPVSGAQTFVHFPAGTRRVDSNGYTDGSGTAPHWLPMEAEVVDVVVRADGLGMVGWRFEIRDDGPIGVEMSPDRGALRVPDSWEAWLVTPGGALVDVGDTLAAIADRGQVQKDGDEFVVRDLAPGTYSYCLPDGVCTRVEVVPWAESRVRD